MTSRLYIDDTGNNEIKEIKIDIYSLWLPLRGTLSFQNFRVLTTFMAINETTTSTMMSASENCERFSTVITFAHILVILPM